MTTEPGQPKSHEGELLRKTELTAEEEKALWLYLNLILRHK